MTTQNNKAAIKAKLQSTGATISCVSHTNNIPHYNVNEEVWFYEVAHISKPMADFYRYFLKARHGGTQLAMRKQYFNQPQE